MAKQLPLLNEKEIPTPRRIYEYLDRYVIGQDRSKRTLAIAAYNHFKRLRSNAAPSVDETPIKKSNVLMVGPSGCGKTHLARNLSRALEVPFVVVDATEYTEAGYYGKDVEVMLGELLFAADLDVDLAQQGIVFVDEIDKIARRNHGERTGAGSRDIGGEGVQQSLLKLLEGATVFVPYNITQHWSKHDFVQMDTTNILFICAGTFTDMKRGKAGRRMGFMREEAPADGGIPREQRVQVEDLMEYGMITEFLGRVPIIAELGELTPEQLVRVMTEPPDSIIREYTRLLMLDGIDLEFTAEALKSIARFASRRKLGARGLRTIIEDIMHDHMFTAPERPGQRVTIAEDEVLKKLA
ncbi:MAG TPA: ATP-dependent Clp protease ATP-binding subunit ClpX [bacterium]|nr:ATP-dependent Clp protease ATP-binding subunit ClpX [bacterium]